MGSLRAETKFLIEENGLAVPRQVEVEVWKSRTNSRVSSFIGNHSFANESVTVFLSVAKRIRNIFAVPLYIAVIRYRVVGTGLTRSNVGRNAPRLLLQHLSSLIQ
jgi:hypothetical protein